MDKVVEYYKKDFWRRIKILFFFDILGRTKLSSEMQEEDSWWDQITPKEVRNF
jgi:hypothetical protein